MAKQLSNIIRAGSGSIPLPISLGGTGLAASGTSGNILVSDGSGWLSSSLPTASDTVKGGVKVGTGLIIDGNGVLSAVNNMTYIDCGSAASVYGGLEFSSINAGGAA
jgi:hypothetical protein